MIFCHACLGLYANGGTGRSWARWGLRVGKLKLTQHIRKPGQDVKKYAVFNKPDVVAALRGWVAAEGDFEACERGVWLRDELNGLIRARPSNSQCAERAV